MIYIHDNEVNNIAECNLLHGFINAPKRAKNINTHYYLILHGCMNIRKGRARFKNFQILLDSGFIYTILMIWLVDKLYPGKDTVMQWQTQSVNITTNFKVNRDFNLPKLSATNVVMWKCHVDNSAKGSYDMILGRHLLIELALNIKSS